jgi:GAF domain-containing protein
MSSYSSLDPESFQNLLADAYVVQESGIDTRSLSAVLELQGLMAESELDVDRAMPLMAERARNVAQATGVAIAILQGDQLVYRAGSGSSAAYVGRRVTAILSVSRHTKSKAEILRVENAQRDGRIEAAICRQFGAESLLILPVYDNRNLVGVLEVIFSDAHSFQEQEVRTYRVMASLLGEVIGRAAQPQTQKAVTEPSAIQPVLASIAPHPGIPKMEPPRVVQPTAPAPQSGFSILGLTSESVSLTRDPLESLRSVAAWLTSNPTLRRAHRTAIASIAAIKLPEVRLPEIKLPERHQLDRALSVVTKQAVQVPYYKRWVAVTVLVLATWVAFRDHRPAPAAPTSGGATAKAVAQPSSSPSAASTAVPAKASAIPALAVVPPVAAKPRWVQVGNDELDYVGQEVTVRYFGVKPAAQLAPAQSRTKKIGSDVTVRYFSPIAASAPERIPSTQIHYVSEDAAAPKRTPTSTAPQSVEQ